MVARHAFQFGVDSAIQLWIRSRLLALGGAHDELCQWKPALGRVGRHNTNATNRFVAPDNNWNCFTAEPQRTQRRSAGGSSVEQRAGCRSQSRWGCLDVQRRRHRASGLPGGSLQEIRLVTRRSSAPPIFSTSSASLAVRQLSCRGMICVSAYVV
jgi:hypothetical protein